jgi:hypothetical protein
LYRANFPKSYRETKMIKSFKVSILTPTLAMALLTPIGGFAFQTTNPPGKNGAPSGPSDKAIAACKARGLVWVPKNTKEYYKSSNLYGKGEGEFMPEAEAQKAGNHEKT